MILKRENLWALFVNFKESARRGHISWEFFVNSKKSAQRGRILRAFFVNSKKIARTGHIVKALLQHLEGTYIFGFSRAGDVSPLPPPRCAPDVTSLRKKCH